MGKTEISAPPAWDLPSVTPPIVPGYQPIFSPHVISGNCVHVSGRLSKRDGQILSGCVGTDISLEEARASARGLALELLGALRDVAGSLYCVAQLGRLFVMVRSAESFPDVHVVANSISEVLLSVLGEHGKHARSVIGAYQLPFGACIEAEITAYLAAETSD